MGMPAEGPFDLDSIPDSCPSCGFNMGSQLHNYVGQISLTLDDGRRISIRSCRPAPPADASGDYLTLHAAVAASATAEICSFLAMGTGVNERDPDGLTPLMHAVSPATVRLLLRKGADPALTDSQGSTALHRCLAQMKMGG